MRAAAKGDLPVMSTLSAAGANVEVRCSPDDVRGDRFRRSRWARWSPQSHPGTWGERQCCCRRCLCCIVHVAAEADQAGAIDVLIEARGDVAEVSERMDASQLMPHVIPGARR